MLEGIKEINEKLLKTALHSLNLYLLFFLKWFSDEEKQAQKSAS